MADKNKEKEVQQKYMEMQLIEQQLQKLQKQMGTMEEQVQEIDQIIHSVSELKDVKKGSEILVPVSSGIFVKAKIEDPNDVYMNVGANVNVKKDLKYAKEVMQKQQDEIKEMRGNFAHAIDKFMERAKGLEKELKSLIEDDN